MSCFPHFFFLAYPNRGTGEVEGIAEGVPSSFDANLGKTSRTHSDTDETVTAATSFIGQIQPKAE